MPATPEPKRNSVGLLKLLVVISLMAAVGLIVLRLRDGTWPVRFQPEFPEVTLRWLQGRVVSERSAGCRLTGFVGDQIVDGAADDFTSIRLSESDTDAELLGGDDEIPLGKVITIERDGPEWLVARGAPAEDPESKQPALAQLVLNIDAERLLAGVELNSLTVAARTLDLVRPMHQKAGGEARSPILLYGSVDRKKETLTLDLPAISKRSKVVVVHSPHRVNVFSDKYPRAFNKGHWNTTDVVVAYDSTSKLLKQTVKELTGSDSADSIRRVVKERVANPAAASARHYAQRDFQFPFLRLDFFLPRADQKGKAYMVVALQETERGSFYAVGNLIVDIPDIADTAHDPAGTVDGTIHHEMFHAIFVSPDYGIEEQRLADKTNSLDGYNEGLATTMGATFQQANGRPSVRTSNSLEEFKLYYELGAPTVGSGYYNQDFFAYVACEYFDDTFAFVTGDDGLLALLGRETNTKSSGMFGGIRDWFSSGSRKVPKHSSLVLQFVYRKVLDQALRNRSGGKVNLHDAYAGFVQNRFIEHNASSVLRTGDKRRPGTPQMDLWNQPPANRTADPNSFGQLTIAKPGTYSIGGNIADSVRIAGFGNLAPYRSALAVVKLGDGFQGDLKVSVEIAGGSLDREGVRIKAYFGGQAGTELAVDGGFQVEDFGESSEPLYLLASNTTLVDGLFAPVPSLSVKIEAESESETKPGQHSGPTGDFRLDSVTYDGPDLRPATPTTLTPIKTAINVPATSPYVRNFQRNYRGADFSGTISYKFPTELKFRHLAVNKSGQLVMAAGLERSASFRVESSVNVQRKAGRPYAVFGYGVRTQVAKTLPKMRRLETGTKPRSAWAPGSWQLRGEVDGKHIRDALLKFNINASPAGYVGLASQFDQQQLEPNHQFQDKLELKLPAGSGAFSVSRYSSDNNFYITIVLVGYAHPAQAFGSGHTLTVRYKMDAPTW